MTIEQCRLASCPACGSAYVVTSSADIAFEEKRAEMNTLSAKMARVGGTARHSLKYDEMQRKYDALRHSLRLYDARRLCPACSEKRGEPVRESNDSPGEKALEGVISEFTLDGCDARRAGLAPRRRRKKSP